MKNTCTDLAIFKNSQGLYTYFSHCFDFWKFQFKNEISALFFSGRDQGDEHKPTCELPPLNFALWGDLVLDHEPKKGRKDISFSKLEFRKTKTVRKERVQTLRIFENRKV